MSLLDLLYSIMLFYGLYLLPMGFFIVSMQFSIGAMLFFRKCAFRYESRTVHYTCALALVLAEILIIISAGLEIEDSEIFGGSLVFILSNIPLLLAMLIKESLIRTQVSFTYLSLCIAICLISKWHFRSSSLLFF